MTDRHVEGVDLDELEEFYKKFEDAVSAAIVAAMRASIKDGAIDAGSVAAVSLDDLNVIPGQWARQVPALAEDLAGIYVKSADMQADAFVRAGGVVTDEVADAVQSEVGRAVRRFTSEHEAALDYLKMASNRLVGIGDDLWADARAELLLGMDAGDSVPQLARRVREATGVTDQRARAVARTEAISASNGGSIAFMRASGMVATKSWLSHIDQRTRPEHRVADGQEVDLEAKFTVGGVPMDHPGDPSAPAHLLVNCRCTMRFGLTPDTADLAQGGDTLAASAHEETAMTTDAGTFQYNGDPRELSVTEVRSLLGDSDAALVAAMDPGNSAPWEGVICVTGTPTGDRRQFDSLTWADLPLPLRRNVVESHGGVPQTQAVLVGRIDTIEMRANEVWASGVIDLGSDAGRETARLMGTRDNPGFLRGVSIDGDEEPGSPSTIEYVFPADCGGLAMADGEPSMDDMARCMEPELSIWSSARIRGATLTDIAALTQANLYLTDAASMGAMVVPGDEEYPMAASAEVVSEPTMADVVESLTAAAHTVVISDVPLAEWFTEPVDFPEFGGVEITDDGRIFGYVAPAGQQHRSYVGSDRKVITPMGNVDYGLWETRARVVDMGDGTTKRIATGAITLDCGHASVSGPQARSGAIAMEHYESSCSLFATACIGENRHGVWIAGALLPDVGPAQIARALACQLSGDWRPHSRRQGMREFAGCLFVPVPGLPASNRKGASTTYRGDALVASAVPVRFGSGAESTGCGCGESTPTDTANAARLIAASVGRDKETRARELYLSVKR